MGFYLNVRGIFGSYLFKEGFNSPFIRNLIRAAIFGRGSLIRLPTWLNIGGWIMLTKSFMVSLHLTAEALLACVCCWKPKLGMVSPLGFVHLGGGLGPFLLPIFLFFFPSIYYCTKAYCLLLPSSSLINLAQLDLLTWLFLGSWALKPFCAQPFLLIALLKCYLQPMRTSPMNFPSLRKPWSFSFQIVSWSKHESQFYPHLTTDLASILVLVFDGNLWEINYEHAADGGAVLMSLGILI